MDGGIKGPTRTTSDSDISDDDDIQQVSKNMKSGFTLKEKKLSLTDKPTQTRTGGMINKLAGLFFNTDKASLGMRSGNSQTFLPSPLRTPVTDEEATSPTKIIFSSDMTPTRTDNNIDRRDLIRNLGGDEPIVSWHPYEQTIEQSSAGECNFHKNCGCSRISNPSSDSELSSDSLVLDPENIFDSNVVMSLVQAPGGSHQMRVENATIIHNNRDEDYKMTSKPRGPCLIINNIDFEGEIFPTRKGSDLDASRFDKLFQQLGFKVIMRRNQTADQMKKLFKDVAAHCKPEHNALFVFILSHGSEYGIYGTDGIEVCLESEIISCFDNRNCKAMLGKPKVFVIQACRGRAKDCGGDGDTTDSVIANSPKSSSPIFKEESLTNRVPANWLPSSQPIEGKLRKHPIRTDMLLVFSCLAGFVSVRNELAGSWLGVALAYFIMTYAHERDLLRILNFVTSDVIQRESSNGHIQSIELRLLGWTKNLYFNPGYYEPGSSKNS